MDSSNYVAPTGRGTYTVVVGGNQVGEFNNQPDAERAFNANAGGATPSPGGSSTPAPSTGGNVYANPSDMSAWAGLANNAAQIAYNNARLALDREQGIMRDEREKERIALEAARDAWNKSYQGSQLSGYNPSIAAGKGQAVMDAIGQLRGNAQYQQADGAGRRVMEAGAISQATGMDPAAAAQAIDRLRTLTAQTGQPSSATLVEQVLGQAGQTPTLARETEQNRTTVDTLRLLAEERGPENAFVYANTIANLPQSIRANIQAAMGRLPFTAQNPAQRGVLGDVGVGGGMVSAQAQQPLGLGAGTWQSQPALPPATGPRTAQSWLPAPQVGQTAQWQGGAQEMAQVAPGSPQEAALRAAMGAYRSAAGPAGVGGGLEQMPTYGPRTTPAQQAGLPPSSTWSPTDYNRTSPYAKKLQLAGYEWAGEDPEHTQWQYQQSLPTAVGPRTGRYRAA